jgi:hypothetical protein
VAIHTLAYSYFDIPSSEAFPQGRRAPRPVLKLTLINPDNNAHQLACYAIIDSGADHCVFPRSFMEPLGFDPHACPTEMIAGVGSKNVPTHYTNATLDLQGIVQYQAYIGFTTGLEELGLGLLGQMGSFDRFRVHFRLPEHSCDIEIL